MKTSRTKEHPHQVFPNWIKPVEYNKFVQLFYTFFKAFILDQILNFGTVTINIYRNIFFFEYRTYVYEIIELLALCNTNVTTIEKCDISDDIYVYLERGRYCFSQCVFK